MTNKWFIEDIETELQHRKRVVILDPKSQCGFLINVLKDKGYTVLKTDSNLTEQWQTVKEELFFRYEAETKHKDKPVIFYVTRNLDKLSFLFDYCFTHGFLDLSNLGDWLKKKIFVYTGLQVNMETLQLFTVAKLGIGKDLIWWKKILQNLEELVSLETELLPFLNNPQGYLNAMDSDIKRLFEEKLFELIEQPYSSKPPETLANEVSAMIFDKLVNNTINSDLLNLYHKWVDSNKYAESLKEYISKYKVNKNTDVWSVHPEHCFEVYDIEALREICKNLRNREYITEKIAVLNLRIQNNRVKKLVPTWWQDVVTLLEFDSKLLVNCNTFDKVVVFYTDSFHKIDRAIRNLYSNFLQEQNIIRPLQEHYESLNHELLQHWFDYETSYKSNQQGYLVDLIKNSKTKTAVIVGDGVRYEIAAFVATTLEKQFKVLKNTMLADIPSETEHNMSALYVGNNQVLAIHKDREKKLSELTGKEITYMNLEALHHGSTGEYLVLTYKDIDSAGEKLQQGAIKLFSEFEKVLSEKIALLLNIGYNNVHLITDHGFVLTGLLEESDKIEPNVKGKKEVHERFIRTAEKQINSNWIGFDKKYSDYNYVYVAKSHRPFKSKGVYGFSHGGFTPQEIIIPSFVFSKNKEASKGLGISIINKKELSDITGEFFGIKIKALSETNDLFTSNRKVKILLYANNKIYSNSNSILIESGMTSSIEFSFSGNIQIEAILVDAISEERLDSVIVKKSNSRDLGGLL
jgi:hypothetical protein